MVANWDIRTQTGGQAIERLSSLEQAIQLFEQEKAHHPELYPSELQYIRFNDALFLGTDVEYLAPPTGQTTLTGGYSIDQLRKLHPKEGQPAFEGTTAQSGSDVAKFLGLVARIHKYINAREAEKSYPGCRTVVASGQRKCFTNRNGVDDFFSANFSVSTAFEAEKRGSSAGLEGNHLYVEDDVATAIFYCAPCYAILGFSKFVYTDPSLVDLYQFRRVQKGEFYLRRGLWTVPEPITLRLMKKRLMFRRLNPTVLTNLQLFKDYQRLAAEQTKNGERLEKEIGDSLLGSTPSLKEVNEKTTVMEDPFQYPFLFLEFRLDRDYATFFGQEQSKEGLTR